MDNSWKGMMTLQLVFVLLALVNCSLAVPVATSHQSMVSGDGYRYSYGIVHGPPGIGHAVGESFPHGYGGFGTYAPSYGYGGYGIGHEHATPALLPHAAVAPLPVIPKPLVPLEPLPVHVHKAPIPVVTKPISIPFEDYVLSSPEHHYSYGGPHYGYSDNYHGFEDHHFVYGDDHYGYGHHHGAPGYGVTHLAHSLYDDHHDALEHYGKTVYFDSPYGYGGYGPH